MRLLITLRKTKTNDAETTEEKLKRIHTNLSELELVSIGFQYYIGPI